MAEPKEVLKLKPSKVPVKCVSERGPWSGGVKLEYWQDYEIDAEDAAILDKQKMVVILKKD